jgi:hypothetical protein
LALAAGSAGCTSFEHTNSVTGPTTGSNTIGALAGTWTSASTSIVPAPSSCTNFKWNATTLTSTSASGSFSATCAGDLNVSGTAQGTMSGTTVNWSADAIATTPSIPSCAVHLSGTADIGVDSIRVPYSGTTCLGPVSGVEVLARR